MPIEFRCPHCQRLLRVPDGSGGKQAQCPQCQAMVQVPVLGGPPTSATPAGAPVAPLAGGANPFSTNFPAAPAGGASENPYQAPTAAMMSPHVTAGPGIYPLVPSKMDLGDLMNRSWEIYKTQLGMLILVLFAVGAINFGANMIASVILQIITVAVNEPAVIVLANFVFQITLFVFQTWLTLGQLKFILKTGRGQPAEFTDIFTGGPYLLTAILGSLLLGVLITAIMLPFAAPPGIVWLVTNDQNATLIAGIICGVLFVPLLTFVLLSISQYQALIVDRNMGVMDSLRMSYEIMSGNRLMAFVLYIALFFSIS